MEDTITVLVDVDDTLYPKGKGPFGLVNRNIDTYVMGLCGIDLESARALRKTYIGAYGSTLQGLMRHYGCDPTDYLRTVHDVPVEEILGPDDRLRDALVGTGCEIVAFTNGSYLYALRILKTLGVRDVIGDLFSIEYMDFVPKPFPWAYRKVMQQYAIRPGQCLVVDDSIANVRTAVRLGMPAVVVGCQDPDGCALSISTIYEIPRVVKRMKTA
jgi:putative hydrolase of the HAD superfamily